jgi:hypothetical protein
VEERERERERETEAIIVDPARWVALPLPAADWPVGRWPVTAEPGPVTRVTCRYASDIITDLVLLQFSNSSLTLITMRFPPSTLLLPALCLHASANVEKTIFLGPSPASIPPTHAALDDLGLERLSPLNPVLRTQLNASFATDEAPQGTESWYFLENLTPGQRYEARICYLATVCTGYPSTHRNHPLTNQTPSNQHPSSSQHTPSPKQSRTPPYSRP